MPITNKALKYDDAIKIARFLVENKYDKYGLTILSEFPSKDILNKVNEEFFYRVNKDTDEKPIQCEEVNVSIEGINFKYILSDAESNQK